MASETIYWQTSRFNIDLSTPRVMGIVNVTPDSFSDGGRHATTVAALKHCERLLHWGADILDIGGESSRPGALPLSLEDELARVLPVVAEAVKLNVPVSVDTYKPDVMQAVLDLGADIINDIRALQGQPEANAANGADEGVGQGMGAGGTSRSQQVVANHPACGICLMHMHRDPQTMQVQPMEGDVVPQVLAFWESSTAALLTLGVEKSRIVLDPGIGFGKTVAQNFQLLARQRELLAPGFPLLIGWSRKSSLAMAVSTSLSTVASLEPKDRMVPSVAAALLAAERGAAILRVHDVRETVQALKVLNAIK
jgi:dihydropteroate synthase